MGTDSQLQFRFAFRINLHFFKVFSRNSSKGDAEKALEKNKQSIGHRYIEVFRSSMMEAQRAQYGGGGGFGGRSGGGGYGMRGGRPGPYDRMGGAPLGRGF